MNDSCILRESKDRGGPVDLWTTRRSTYGQLVDCPMKCWCMKCEGEGGAAHEPAHSLRTIGGFPTSPQAIRII
jgi:hypothetical protein